MRWDTATVEASTVSSDIVSSVHEIPPQALELLAAPPLNTLSPDRAHGAVCLWCPERLTAETAVDLGEQTDPEAGRWWPRACGPCAGRRAHDALYDHAARCEPCVDDVGQCETGLALTRLVRRHRR
ncbi:hypothetical protein TU94_18015 [Streptomyces cyaneogriseus subsp. noncyanogenus]|uniref:Uncharacterized protein n=1 Tax=Streptomyces cyaneogriseus subsp. noncyanogenus TaxID=477245 RepID=A0A0C5FSS3_9ACTN|nr:hypothetical protein TU94_18015 [Streptomyces cyaneogriseus subsp. noncyanogenus]